MADLKGIAASRGIIKGSAFVYVKEEKKIEAAICADKDAEKARFADARTKAIEQLDKLHETAVETVGEKDAMIFEIHGAMVDSPDFIEAAEAYIDQGFVAEYAVDRAGQELSAMFSQMDDAYLRERAADVVDISSRVIRILQGKGDDESLFPSYPHILIADDLLPSETIKMDTKLVLAFATNRGSHTSHSAILARNLGIPAIVGIGDGLNAVKTGDEIIVDGSKGVLKYDFSEQDATAYDVARAEWLSYLETLQKMKGQKSITLDGTEIEICANIGSPQDADQVIENDADGVGLFRSEFLYMESDNFPTEDEQFEAYKYVLMKLPGKRVIIRTFDIGADKALPYIDLGQEENPAIGRRAIRVCFAFPDLFRTQIRALLRASAFGRLAIMFPMIATMDELHEAKAMVEKCKAELDAEGIAYSKDLEVGMMIEVPSAALIADKLAKEVDFFSIGTNDLTQFTMAVDRVNANVAPIFDSAHESILRLMDFAAKSARRNGKFCGICGESGSDPNLIEYFLRMGVNELSVSPTKVLEVREKVRSIDLSKPAPCPYAVVE